MNWKLFVAISIVSIMIVQIGCPTAHAQTKPVIVGSNINPCGPGLHSCSVTVAPGGTTYMYGAAIGGSFGISPIDFSADVAVTNQENNQAVLVGHSNSNTGTFNPGGALFPIIGGIGVSGTLSQIITFSNVGMDSISGSFSLGQDSLVVLVAAASQNNFPSVSEQFTVDQTFTYCCDSVVIAHASMSAGIQQFSISYAFGTGGNADPTERGIGVALYIFSSVPGCGQTSSAIQSDFNGSPIPAGDYIWFNSVLKLNSPAPAVPLSIFSTGQVISFQAGNAVYDLNVPNANVTFNPSATSATTTFNPADNTWDTTVPANFTDNVFLSGLAYQVSSGGLPGNIHGVNWNGTFSGSASFSVHWQWGAAVYTNFTSNYNSLGVKASHSTMIDQFKNGDEAGTPENYKNYVVGGATGGGGSNYTGSYSGTGSANGIC